MPRGGKREGAGRPCAGTVPVKVRLTERQRVIFQALGGSKWLQHKLTEEETKMTKFETFSSSAKHIISELFWNGPLTIGAALDALEDGEYLASIKATEETVAEAYSYIESIAAGRDTELSLYEISGAIAKADAFPYDEALCSKLLDCYEDCVTLGLFAKDEDAVAAAEARQAADDAKAEKILAAALGADVALEGGPAYCAGLCRYTAEDLERVEL